MIVLGFGAAVEFLGLASGFPFGHYHYTAHWAPIVELPVVGHFPILLPAAWLLVVTSAVYAVGESPQPLLQALLAGGIATLLDWPMEKLMAGPLDYWRWRDGSPPALNYLGWFVCAAIAAYLFNRQVPARAAYEKSARTVLLGRLVLILGLLALYQLPLKS